MARPGETVAEWMRRMNVRKHRDWEAIGKDVFGVFFLLLIVWAYGSLLFSGH